MDFFRAPPARMLLHPYQKSACGSCGVRLNNGSLMVCAQEAGSSHQMIQSGKFRYTNCLAARGSTLLRSSARARDPMLT